MGQEKLTEIRFARGQAGADEIQRVADDVLTELRDPSSDTARRARQAGLDPAELANARVSVNEEAGVAPLLVMIVVGIASSAGGGFAAHVANTFWDDVIWPRIKQRLGGLAVGGRKA